MNYLLISNLALLFLFLIYRFGFKKLTFFSLNRWYLLSIIFIAYLLPLVLYMDVRMPEIIQVQLPVLDLTLHTAQVKTDATVNIGQGPSWFSQNGLFLGYWIGVVLTIAWLAYRVYSLIDNRTRNNKGSYSFFGKIKVEEVGNHADIILQHEMVHRKQGHSYDLIFVEVIRVFNWFNPVFILIRDELKFQHECIVDEHFSEDRVAYAELLVAYAMKVNPAQLSHEFSNKSLLKERIKMIFKDKSKSRNRIFYLSIVPMALIILGLTINCKSGNKEEKSVTEITTEENPVSVPVQDSIPAEGKVIEEVEKEEKINFPEPKVTEAKADNQVYEYGKVEILPDYRGGLNKFRKEVAQAIVYPQAAIDAGVEGKTELQFIITARGQVEDIKVVSALGYGIDQAAVNALKTVMKNNKNWMPGIVNGQKVAVRYSLPIRLDLSRK